MAEKPDKLDGERVSDGRFEATVPATERFWDAAPPPLWVTVPETDPRGAVDLMRTYTTWETLPELGAIVWLPAKVLLLRLTSKFVGAVTVMLPDRLDPVTV